MSTSSDSEEFYDAEDITPCRITRKYPNRQSSEHKRLVRSESEPTLKDNNCEITFVLPSKFEINTDLQTTFQQNIKNEEISKQSFTDIRQSRQKFRELRQRMQTDDDDINDSNVSPPDSQTSSTDGMFAAINSSGRSSHPFRVIEHDAMSLQSMSSLGRVGRILSGSNNLSASTLNRDFNTHSMSTLSQSSKDSTSATPDSCSKYDSQFPSTLTLSAENILGHEVAVSNKIEPDNIDESQELPIRPTALPLQEPDVIASTKSSNTITNVLKSDPKLEALLQGPIAPPRRKKKTKSNNSSCGISVSDNSDMFTSTITSLTSPASTIESLTREFEHSLDRTNSHYTTRSLNGENYSKSANTSRSNTIKSLSHDFENSLDIRSAIRGKYVVKPQDEDKSKAEGPTSDELLRIEQLKKQLLNTEFGTNYVPSVSSTSNNVGHSSLGSHRSVMISYNVLSSGTRNAKERRRSAGDEDMIKQLNMFVRTRTDSGKQLTDMEILEQVTVLNLDTGERVPLSIAEDKLPQCINPLSLHIMRLTSEYVSTTSLDKEKESDEESVGSKQSTIPADEIEGGRMKRTTKLKRFLGSTVKKTMHKAKSIAHEVSHARHKEDIMDIVDEVNPGEQNIKLKASNSHKGPYELENMQHVQELSAATSREDTIAGHMGPIWCMKFSSCGRLLATAGQDRVLRVWVVKEAHPYFQDMRNKYNAEKISPTPSQESLGTNQTKEDISNIESEMSGSEVNRHIFMEKPFCTYTGHTSDLLDVSWSKNYFLLSSSMDKTVRLWHISRNECLCCFQHIDFVTAIVFHPRDDRYFLSGSLDGKLRLWNIPDKKVAVWNEVDGQTKLITAANFCQNGKFAVVGSYDGRCIFYNTDQLKYHTQIHVRSTRGRNSTGRKISGIEPMPGEDKILVTSNDSRIRLYDLRDLNLSCKYKGYVNVSSQIKASFSHDGKYIVSGSENRDIYVWKTHHDYSKFSSVRRDRNDFWEAIKAHNAVVTCAVFAPNPDSIIKMIDERLGTNSVEPDDEKEEDPMVEQRTKGCGGHVLVSADFNGCIKVFINKMKPKHSSLPASALV